MSTQFVSVCTRIRFDRFDYVFDSTDFQTPGDRVPPPQGYSTVPFQQLGAFAEAAVDADDQDKDSASDVQRFIIFLATLATYLLATYLWLVLIG